MLVILLLGVPGAGKGTLAIQLADRLGVSHLSTGDMLREISVIDSKLGEEIRSYTDKGQLIPDELMSSMITEKLKGYEQTKGVILDGFPRNLEQAKLLEIIVKQLQEEVVSKAIFLSVGLDVAIERLIYRISCSKCGAPYHLKFSPPQKDSVCDRCGGKIIKRSDDNEQTIIKRFDTYVKRTEPLINFYEEQGSLVTIDASRSPDAILAEVESLFR